MGNTDQITTQRRPLPPSLTKAIERAGYYPALVADVVESAVAGDEVRLTPGAPGDDVRPRHRASPHHGARADATRLVVAHADDHAPEHDESEPDHADPQSSATATATATSECVPLSAVRGVMLTHVWPHRRPMCLALWVASSP
jgi:hypothetical protein